jgi:hypothetical protein
MPEGKFNLQSYITQLRKKGQHSTKHGRRGLRGVRDMNPFLDMRMADEAIKYKSFDKKFDLTLTWFCAYTKDRLQQLENSTVQLLYQYHTSVIGGATIRK